MAGIAALGVVLKLLLPQKTFAHGEKLGNYRKALEKSLRTAFPGVVFNAPLEHCLPTTLNFSVPGISSKTLLNVLDAASLCVSAGSACSAARSEPSYVLEAMGLPHWRTTSAVRMSFGPLVDGSTIAAACDAILRCGAALAVSARAAGTALQNESPSREQGALALQWAELESFMTAHPGAVLVDVREAAEHAVGSRIEYAGKCAVNAPLGALPEVASQWMVAGATPVVFFCRSGNRSLQAAQWLSARGHPAVRHVHGGVAMRTALPSITVAA